jgi:capsule polysaccharide export protein KpsE/RkpR
MASKINDYLEESDMLSVRDLYMKLKEILSQEGMDKALGINDTQVLELHDVLD